MLSFIVKVLGIFSVEGLDKQCNRKLSHDIWLRYVGQLPRPSLGGLLEDSEDVTGFLAVFILNV
jgi:hypothetical protein